MGIPLLLACVAFFAGCFKSKVLSIQQSPGVEGNGEVPQPGPYVAPPEVAGHVNGAPAGTLTEPALFFSRIYGLQFKYRVYAPAGYKKGTPAALMVFQDASSVYLGLMNTPVVLDNLIHSGEMPVTIALFLDPGSDSSSYAHARDSVKRSAQYDAMDIRYGSFLVQEIIPAVLKKNYTLVNDPNGWAIAGHNSGGVAAFTVAWNWSDYFRKVLTQNGSFVDIRGGNRYPALVRTELVKPLRVYLLSGTNDLNNEFGSWFDGNRALAAALAAREYDVRFRPGTGTHSPPVQAQADFPDALRWLWRGYYVGLKGKKQ